MRWNQGRDAIDRMLADSELQRVPASREHADRLILQARKHLISANEICADDSPGGYRIRRLRHDVEYPPTDAPQIDADDVREDATKATAIVDLSERLLDEMSPF